MAWHGGKHHGDMHGWGRHNRERDGGRHYGRRGGPGMESRGPGGPKGAEFRFRSGDDGPSFTIRCAERDTTQDCVDAVMPMIQTLTPGQSE